jgi:hypothetical protein
VTLIVAYYEDLMRRRPPLKGRHKADVKKEDTPFDKTKALCKRWEIYPVGNRPVTKHTIAKWRTKFGKTDLCQRLTQQLADMDEAMALAAVYRDLWELDRADRRWRRK